MLPTPAMIKQTRNEAGLTQTEAAKLVSSDVRTWQYWESGQIKMHSAKWEVFLIKTRFLEKTKDTK